MITESYIKYLLADERSLYMYFKECMPVPFDDVKRSLMLEERTNNIYIPDHHYRLGQERTFKDLKNINDILTSGLFSLAQQYMEYANGKIFIKAQMQPEWQLLLPYIPPLILLAATIYQTFPAIDNDEVKYITDHIIPNIRHTCLPSPFVPQLNELRTRNQGMYDLHMHLNGTLETDIVWQDFLQYPDRIYMELRKAESNEKVKEQYEQLSPFLSAYKFSKLLRIAACLRDKLYRYVVHHDRGDLNSGAIQLTLNNLYLESVKNVSRNYIWNDLQKKSLQPHYIEAYFYVRMFDYLIHNPYDEYTGSLFHYYLLILGQANKLLVQQPNCFGFDEFQKHTLNGLREFSEQMFNRRFFQLSGNQLNNIKVLEGRFSPKTTHQDNMKLIGRIVSAWNTFTKRQKQEGLPATSRLKLTAHFIKKRDTRSNPEIRHYELRKDVEHRARLLRMLKNEGHSLSRYVTGIDDAANELEAPPEVFANSFKLLRKAGYTHFTYHAGEDFHHVLSGLRAIYEAISYLELQHGDRIGHASAAGIPVDLWAQNLGPKVVIRIGEYLDDLIFAYHLINENRDYVSKELYNLLPYLSIRISELSYRIYRTPVSQERLRLAWQKRGEDPAALLRKDKLDDIEELYLQYHFKDYVDRYNEIEELDVFEIFGEKELTELQKLTLRHMHAKDIVVETLPTSNVIIGVHHSYSTYHLFNWYKWSKEGCPMPSIVVGTDDAGIFATNIYNEYCNIFCQLKYKHQMNNDDILELLNKIHYNSSIYSFDAL